MSKKEPKQEAEQKVKKEAKQEVEQRLDSDKSAATASASSTPSAKADNIAMDKTLAADNAQPKVRRRLRGVVVGNRADKTARVRVERQIRHPLYEKIIRRHRDVQAHDADNACLMGESVVVEEMPRVSKTKGWRVVERPLADKEVS